MNKFLQGVCYVRHETFSIDEILPKLGSGELFVWNEMIAKTGTTRLRTFANNIVCVRCGLAGSFFALEHDKAQFPKGPPHLNLYGINEDGQELLFTKDHIMPASKGGLNTVDNLQTMCCVCNQLKAASVLDGKVAKFPDVEFGTSLFSGMDLIAIER